VLTVAIGSDGCGNFLVFLPSKADIGVLDSSLFVWWHEGGELERVAGDFNEAIGG